MKAEVGSWLVIVGAKADDRRRAGKIVEVNGPDGAPPYRVRWLADGHESLVFPGPDARVQRELHHAAPPRQ